MEKTIKILCLLLIVSLLSFIGYDANKTSTSKKEPLPRTDEVVFLRLVETPLDILEKYKYPFEEFTINDRNVISKLISSLHSARSTRPNHPIFVQCCDLEIITNEKTFVVALSASPKKYVYFWGDNGYSESEELYEILSDLVKTYSKNDSITTSPTEPRELGPVD